MLGGAVLEVLESDVILVTTSAVYAGVATKARFSSISLLTRVYNAGAGVISTAAKMVITPLSSKSQLGKYNLL